MAQLLTMMEALRKQNETLQDNVTNLQQRNIGDDGSEEELLEPQPLSQAIWDDQVP